MSVIAGVRQWWQVRKGVRTTREALHRLDEAARHSLPLNPAHMPDREGIWQCNLDAPDGVWRKVPWDQAEAHARARQSQGLVEFIQAARRTVFTESEYPE